jgi:hypothetical protein
MKRRRMGLRIGPGFGERRPEELGTMMAWARRRRALKALEKELAASEPHLEAMFAIFARLTWDENPGDAEQLPRRWGLLT